MGSRVRVPSGPPETKVFGSLWIKDFFILIQGVEILLKMICTCPKMKPFRWRTEWKLWGYEVSIKTKKTWKIFFQVFFCGQWWIRTTEGESQLSYSQPHLATLVTALLSPLLALLLPFENPQMGRWHHKLGANIRTILEIPKLLGELSSPKWLLRVGYR